MSDWTHGAPAGMRMQDALLKMQDALLKMQELASSVQKPANRRVLATDVTQA